MGNKYDSGWSRMLYNRVIVSDSSANNEGMVVTLKNKEEQLCCEG